MGPRAALVSLGLMVSALAPGGCVLSRREVMLVLSTDADCNVFDRVQVRITRGAEPGATFDQMFLRADCPARNFSPPSVPLRMVMPAEVPSAGDFRLGIVDSRRANARVRIDVTARTPEGEVFTTSAETEFVDDRVYAVPMRLSVACANNALTCPSGQVCRIAPGTEQAACGSIYRAPGTLGTFPTVQAAHVVVDE